MIAGPTSPIGTMTRAVARTVNMLNIAATVDLDRSAEDRAFFQGEAKTLRPLLTALIAKKREIEDFDLGPGDLNQAAVLMGDAVLDRGVRAGNTRTKLGLSGKTGLGSTHVFGNRVDDLTSAPLKLEPSRVREAAERLDEVPDFDDKAKVKSDLLGRAEQQDSLLATRDTGLAERAKLESEAVKLVVDAAHKLAQTKAALDGRFSRQREYVATFFLDTSRKRKASKNDEGDDGEGSGEGSDG